MLDELYSYHILVLGASVWLCLKALVKWGAGVFRDVLLRRLTVVRWRTHGGRLLLMGSVLVLYNLVLAVAGWTGAELYRDLLFPGVVGAAAVFFLDICRVARWFRGSGRRRSWVERNHGSWAEYTDYGLYGQRRGIFG